MYFHLEHLQFYYKRNAEMENMDKNLSCDFVEVDFYRPSRTHCTKCDEFARIFLLFGPSDLDHLVVQLN